MIPIVARNGAPFIQNSLSVEQLRKRVAGVEVAVSGVSILEEYPAQDILKAKVCDVSTSQQTLVQLYIDFNLGQIDAVDKANLAFVPA